MGGKFGRGLLLQLPRLGQLAGRDAGIGGHEAIPGPELQFGAQIGEHGIGRKQLRGGPGQRGRAAFIAGAERVDALGEDGGGFFAEFGIARRTGIFDLAGLEPDSGRKHQFGRAEQAAQFGDIDLRLILILKRVQQYVGGVKLKPPAGQRAGRLIIAILGRGLGLSGQARGQKLRRLEGEIDICLGQVGLKGLEDLQRLGDVVALGKGPQVVLVGLDPRPPLVFRAGAGDLVPRLGQRQGAGRVALGPVDIAGGGVITRGGNGRAGPGRIQIGDALAIQHELGQQRLILFGQGAEFLHILQQSGLPLRVVKPRLGQRKLDAAAGAGRQFIHIKPQFPVLKIDQPGLHELFIEPQAVHQFAVGGHEFFRGRARAAGQYGREFGLHSGRKAA